MPSADRPNEERNGEITVVDDPDAGRYEANFNGELAAYVTYRRSPGRIVFIETETLEGFTGHGVASHLIRAALDEAREPNRAS